MGVLSKLLGKSKEESATEVSAEAPQAQIPGASTDTRGSELWKKVERVLDMIRPAIQMDGGDISLVDVREDGTVYIRMEGHCVGCPMSQMTLQMGIERTLKDHIAEVTQVLAV